MKKLIIILFMFSFVANGQKTVRTWQPSEDWSFQTDKKLHVYVAAGTSAAIFTTTYLVTKDEALAFRAGIIITAFPIIAWEGLGFMTGKEISLADVSYGLGSAIVTSTLSYVVVKISRKVEAKRRLNRYMKEFEQLQEDGWSLENKFINNLK